MSKYNAKISIDILSLKIKTKVIDFLKFISVFIFKAGMLGMKRDCGGAAAVLGAFYAAVKLVSIEMIFTKYAFFVALDN